MAPSLSQPTQATSGPHTLIYLSCLSERLFPPRERWGLTRFTLVYEMKLILGRAHASSDKKRTFFVSFLSPTTSVTHTTSISTARISDGWSHAQCLQKLGTKNMQFKSQLTYSILYFLIDYFWLLILPYIAFSTFGNFTQLYYKWVEMVICFNCTQSNQSFTKKSKTF